MKNIYILTTAQLQDICNICVFVLTLDRTYNYVRTQVFRNVQKPTI